MPNDPNEANTNTPKVLRRHVIAYLRSALDQADSEIGDSSAQMIRMVIQSLEREETDIVFVDSG